MNENKSELLLKIILNYCKSESSNIEIDSHIIADQHKILVDSARKNGIQLPIISEMVKTTPNPSKEMIATYNIIKGEYSYFWATVKRINELFKDDHLDLLIIKTKRKYPFYNGDVNILVRQSDWYYAVELLSKNGWKKAEKRKDLKKFFFEPDKLWFYGNETLYPVHLHRTISWHGLEYIPGNLIFLNCVKQNIEGVDIQTPSNTFDILIHCAHTIFENYELKLGEAYHVIKVMEKEKIDLQIMIDVAREYGWSKGLNLAVGTIKALNDTYPMGNVSNDDLIPAIPIVNNNVSFPYKYDKGHLLETWLERSGFHLIKEKSVKKSLRELWRHPAYYLYKNF